MTESEIERFFTAAAARCNATATILMIGGGAAIVLSAARTTSDLDLEIHVPGEPRDPDAAAAPVLAALQEASRLTGIDLQAATNIEKWSMIGWADYRHHLRVWKTFGTLTVSVLEPEYFAHTKLLRYSEVDVLDIRNVLTRHRTSWRKLADVSGRALRMSPLSTAQDSFRRQVEHFFRTEGRTIWKSDFDPEDAIHLFRKAANMRPAA